MRKTDINQYTGTPIKGGDLLAVADNKVASNVVIKILKTLLAVAILTTIIVGITTVALVISVSNETVGIDLRDLKLNLTSMIYINDENGNPKEYQQVHASEKRIWVDYDQIPQDMKDAVVAIEDKRFYEHDGVDWKRTLGATLSYFTGNHSYGGSTITQQLIKNLTNKKDVSVSRKLSEIVNSLVLERKYSKDEILEAYLNVVNFGNNCNGVEAASTTYFNQSVIDCNAAQCASIAGITQNPSAYNPFLHPEANKTRQQTVLGEMRSQNMLTDSEYNEAMAQSQDMQFCTENSNRVDKVPINNWYIENMLTDLTKDLSKQQNIDEKTAQYMLMNNGYRIYSAMDENAQNTAESVIQDNSQGVLPADPALQVGFVMMDYSGRMLATIGQRGEKQGNFLWDCGNIATRQPGSSIKPISVYAPALEQRYICYSSKIKDAPISSVKYDDGTPWPRNWYNAYRGSMLVTTALEISSNAVTAQVLDMLSLQSSFDFLTQKVGITNLNPDVDMTYSGLSTGGGYNGITVRNMTAAFQIFGNDGTYTKPYTYYYVEDSLGNVLLDNRNQDGSYAISPGNASIMRHLLYGPVEGSQGTATAARIGGWKVFGKTGTTDDDKNSWFIGGSPYALAGIWTGYETPTRIRDTSAAIRIWRSVMAGYLNNMDKKDFVDDPSVKSMYYNSYSGLLANGGVTGYYLDGNSPGEQELSHSPTSILNGPGGGSAAVAPKSSVPASSFRSYQRQPQQTSQYQPQPEPEPESEPESEASSQSSSEQSSVEPVF